MDRKEEQEEGEGKREGRNLTQLYMVTTEGRMRGLGLQMAEASHLGRV